MNVTASVNKITHKPSFVAFRVQLIYLSSRQHNHLAGCDHMTDLAGGLDSLKSDGINGMSDGINDLQTSIWILIESSITRWRWWRRVTLRKTIN